MAAAQEVIDFFSDGSSRPDLARQELAHANAYGYDAMWVILRIDGEIVGRLDEKIAPYRLKPGRVSWQARQIDGPGMVSTRSVGPEGYGDRGFQAGGVSFPTVGCWEVTYTLDGRDDLRFVLRVR